MQLSLEKKRLEEERIQKELAEGFAHKEREARERAEAKIEEYRNKVREVVKEKEEEIRMAEQRAMLASSSS
jgi:hypothetical protein